MGQLKSVNTNGKGDILEFQERERVSADNTDVVVYEATANNSLFGYLYVNPRKYALAWNGPRAFQFDGKQPFSFVEELLSVKSPLRVEYLDLVLPPQRPQNPETALRQWGFYYDRSTVTLVLTNGHQDLIEYDLLDDNDREHYLAVLKDPKTTVGIAFARYDSLIKCREESELSYRFSLESPGDGAADWEFAINLPREMPLTLRAFKWIVKHHHDENWKHSENLEESLTTLFKIINEPVRFD